MSLLVPDSGLLFWMLISFGIVFFILAKFAFPFITKSVENRRNYVETSLKEARQAEVKLAKVKEEGDEIVASANKEQGRLLRIASEQRDKIIAEAKNKASVAAQKELDAAREQITKEREDAIIALRREVAVLSCDIAEKVVREQLSDKDRQMAMIDRMLEEVDKINA
ncbi:MAG: F0F1 ATP synthase subunit B [Candidatus Egerieousia sp.]